MKVALRFPVVRPIHVSDAWPLKVADATIELEREGTEVRAILVTFLGQALELGPVVQGNGGTLNLKFQGVLEQRAKSIVSRFQDFLSLYFQIEIDTDHIERSYTGESPEEDDALIARGLTLDQTRSPSWIPFGIIAPAVFATESDADVSFTASMLRLGRRSLERKEHIDAFRYFFMILEGLFGAGQSRQAALRDAFLAAPSLVFAIQQTRSQLLSDPIERNSPARLLLGALTTPEQVVGHLVERRGFYFHSNPQRPGGWHPARQTEAEPLAWFTAALAQSVAMTFAEPIHHPSMGSRYLDEARRQGAVMNLEIEFEVAENNDRRSRPNILTMEVPGTVLTTDLAMTLLKHAGTWAEVHQLGRPVRHITARIVDTGEVLFRVALLDAASESPTA